MKDYTYTLTTPSGVILEAGFARRFAAHDRASFLAQRRGEEVYIVEVSPWRHARVGKADVGGYVTGLNAQTVEVHNA